MARLARPGGALQRSRHVEASAPINAEAHGMVHPYEDMAHIVPLRSCASTLNQVFELACAMQAYFPQQEASCIEIACTHMLEVERSVTDAVGFECRRPLPKRAEAIIADHHIRLQDNRPPPT